MLVLSRARGEAVTLVVRGVAVEVFLLKAGRSEVKLGFQAPAEVSIIRSECLRAPAGRS